MRMRDLTPASIIDLKPADVPSDQHGNWPCASCGRSCHVGETWVVTVSTGAETRDLIVCPDCATKAGAAAAPTE